LQPAATEQDVSVPRLLLLLLLMLLLGCNACSSPASDQWQPAATAQDVSVPRLLLLFNAAGLQCHFQSYYLPLQSLTQLPPRFAALIPDTRPAGATLQQHT
jgi:hypothetical protein